jgi:hypothetical protein
VPASPEIFLEHETFAHAAAELRERLAQYTSIQPPAPAIRNAWAARNECLSDWFKSSSKDLPAALWQAELTGPRLLVVTLTVRHNVRDEAAQVGAPITEQLRRELGEYSDRYPKLGDDELFVLWFLRAFVTESEDEAAEALCGGPRDKGVDAVLLDEKARIVFVVQGKYRKTLSRKTENRRDVTSFAGLEIKQLPKDFF